MKCYKEIVSIIKVLYKNNKQTAHGPHEIQLINNELRSITMRFEKLM